MVDRKKVTKGLKCCITSLMGECKSDCPYTEDCHRSALMFDLLCNALELINGQQETINSFQHTINALNKGIAEQAKEPVKPTVDRFGNARCICGEIVGFISRGETPWKICLNYCHYCGRKLVWE